MQSLTVLLHKQTKRKYKLYVFWALGILLNFQGYALYGQGLLELAQEKKEQIAYTSALQLLRQARTEIGVNEKESKFSLYNEMGEIFLSIGEFDSTTTYLNLPANWEDLDETLYGSLKAQRYLLLIQQALLTKNYSQALPLLEKAEKLLPSYAPELRPDFQLKRVRLEIGTGKWGDAWERIEALEENLDSFTPEQKGDFHFEKGIYHMFYKRLDLAEESLEKAEHYYQKIFAPLHPKIGLTHTFLSYTYRGKFKLKESIESAHKAMKIQEQVLTDKHPHLATTYYYYSTTLNTIGDFASSARYVEQAIRVYKKALGDQGIALGNYYGSLGFTKQGLNQLDESVLAFEKALQYYNDFPAFRGLDKQYYNYSQTFYKMDDFESALTYLEKAYQLGSKKYGENDPNLLNIYKAFGEVYIKQKKYKLAKSYYVKSLEIEENNPDREGIRIADCLHNLGKIERETGNLEKAFEFQQKALEEMGLDLSMETLDELDVVATGRPKLLIEIFLEIGKELTELAEKSEHPREEKDRALNIYLHCDHFIDQRRVSFLSVDAKLTLGGIAHETFEKGIELAFDLFKETQEVKYLETAFYLSGKSKSLMLLMGLKESFALKSSGIPEALTTQEVELDLAISDKKSEQFQLKLQPGENATEKLANIEQELFHLNKSKDSLINILEQAYPDYYQIKYDLDLPSVSELQFKLPQDMGLVDYFWGEKDLYIFFLTKDKIQGFITTEIDSLQDQLTALQDLIISPSQLEREGDFDKNQALFVSASHELYQKLLGPLELRLYPEMNRLKIIPDGNLGLLQFNLLISDIGEPSNVYRSLAYLIRDYAISYAYSIGQWWHVLQKGPVPLQGRDDLLAFRPTYPEIADAKELDIVSRRGFGPLYFSELEIENITRYFDSQVFEGSEATEKSFYQLAPDFPLIQISGHAMIPDSAPNAAFIAFTDVNSSQYDDSLMLEELYALQLNAEMVVLSACETGVGEWFEGEGIMSLGRGFTYAGARSLIMSLWEVNDASTSQIMSDFYENLSQNQPKDIALQAAMLTYLKSSDQLHAHPYYWSAFVANGDMREVESTKRMPSYLYLLGILAMLAGITYLVYTKRRASSAS